MSPVRTQRCLAEGVSVETLATHLYHGLENPLFSLTICKGRKPSIKAEEVRRLSKEGLGATEIARKLGVGRASVYRHLQG